MGSKLTTRSRYLANTATIVAATSLSNVTINNNDNQPNVSYWQGNTKFGFDLLHQSRKLNKNTNIVFSPFSITSAFSLVYGANPKTSQSNQEISKSLYFPTHLFENNIDKSSSVDITQHILNIQQDLLDDCKNMPHTDVNIANAIFYHQALPLDEAFNQEFVQTIGEQCFKSLDFTNLNKTVDEMNKWVAKNTNNRIQRAVNSKMIETAHMVLFSVKYS